MQKEVKERKVAKKYLWIITVLVLGAFFSTIFAIYRPTYDFTEIFPLRFGVSRFVVGMVVTVVVATFIYFYLKRKSFVECGRGGEE